MKKMINEEIITKMVIDEVCYEGNVDDCGRPYWNADDVSDIDTLIDIISNVWITGPYIKGRREHIMRIEDHDILFWETMSILNTMDIEELASKVESEIDSCITYWDDRTYRYH